MNKNLGLNPDHWKWVHVGKQAYLFDLAPIQPVKHEETPTLDERFAAFDAANPHVFHILYSLSVSEAADVATGNLARGSIAYLYETLRRLPIQTNGEAYKLPNEFRALYARKLMRLYPTLDGLFETRIRKAPGAINE